MHTGGGALCAHKTTISIRYTHSQATERASSLEGYTHWTLMHTFTSARPPRHFCAHLADCGRLVVPKTRKPAKARLHLGKNMIDPKGNPLYPPSWCMGRTILVRPQALLAAAAAVSSPHIRQKLVAELRALVWTCASTSRRFACAFLEPLWPAVRLCACACVPKCASVPQRGSSSLEPALPSFEAGKRYAREAIPAARALLYSQAASQPVNKTLLLD